MKRLAFGLIALAVLALAFAVFNFFVEWDRSIYRECRQTHPSWYCGARR